jgi:hypothetical protein
MRKFLLCIGVAALLASPAIAADTPAPKELSMNTMRLVAPMIERCAVGALGAGTMYLNQGDLVAAKRAADFGKNIMDNYAVIYVKAGGDLDQFKQDIMLAQTMPSMAYLEDYDGCRISFQKMMAAAYLHG